MMNGGVSRLAHEDDSDDEVLATTLVEAMQEDEGDYDDVSVSGGIQVTGDDLQARLAAAATPLEFQAGLPARFQSYDNYCSLFHFILNSDGPVDLELPTVSFAPGREECVAEMDRQGLMDCRGFFSTTGLGT
jgi:translation initiation factor 3 subunit L